MSDSEKISELFASLEDGSAIVHDAESLALQIADQNSRYREANEVLKDEPEILELVRFGIAEEQEETFTNIISITPEASPIYKNLGRASLLIENGLESAQTTVHVLENRVRVEEARLEEQRERQQQQTRQKNEELLANVQRLAPRAVETVRELLKTRDTEDISSQEIDELEDHVLELMDQEDEAKKELEKIKKASGSLDVIMGGVALSWEMPLALQDYGSSYFTALDELPVDPEINSCESGVVKSISERHVDQPKAALYTAICLRENAGQTVTVDQIAQALYSPEVIKKFSVYHIRSRVTTTLGPKVRGESLREILDEEGFILQYGWRRILEKKPDGHIVVVRRERIYRAIEKEKLDEYMDLDTIEGDDFSDRFESLHMYQPVEEVVTKLETPKESAEVIDLPEEVQATDTPETVLDETPPLRLVTEHDDHHETKHQRKERLKNELLAAITGPARLVIKAIGDHGALEVGGIKLGHLKHIYAASEIPDEEFHHIISNRISPHESQWLHIQDAVRLVLSVTLEDDVARVNVGSRQWRKVVNEKIDELVQRELRGIERRKALNS